MNPKTEKLLAARQELHEEICYVAKIVLNIERNRDYNFDNSEIIHICGNTVELSWEDSFCCDTIYEEISFPVHYLFNDNWEERLRERKAKERAEEEAVRQKKLQDDAIEKLKKERALYLELRAKFKGED